MTMLQPSALIFFTASVGFLCCGSVVFSQQNAYLEKRTPSSLAPQNVDPFQINDSPQTVRKVDPSLNDPFDPTLVEVAKTAKDPIPFSSLPANELVKMEEKIRMMRIRVLKNAIEVVRAELQTATDKVGSMREYAELIEEVTTLEFQQAKSSTERQAAIQTAIDAWRQEEKNVFDKQDATRAALAMYLGSRYRLRWEQALVKELRATSEVKSSSTSVVYSTPIHSTVVLPQTVYYPSVQQPAIIEQPSQTYYYPQQQTYSNPRSYRSR
jgi:hypothetical protein